MPFRLANDALNRTAGQCVSSGWGVSVNCACGYRARLPQAQLAAMAPATTLVEIASRLVCSQCGGTEGVVHTHNARSHPGYA